MASEQLADVLSEFARTMVTDFPIQRILDHLVKRIVEILPISAAGVTLIAPDSHPHYVAASNGSALRYEKLQTTLGEGPCLVAYLTGEAVSVPDLSREDRFPRFAARALEAGLTAVFTFPLHHGDSQLGALDLYRGTAGPMSVESMRSAQTLADVAAAYLLNAQARAALQEASDRSSEAALHDALTGLPNRALILERLEHAFSRRQRAGSTCALFFLDLNHFKAINDTYGHQMGDELLVAVGERLTAVLRPDDTLARLSGDEFVILCEDLDGEAASDAIAVRVDAALARPFALSGADVKITASLGMAFTGRGNDTPEELIRAADLAMYRTKHKYDERGQMFDLRELHIAGDQAGLGQRLAGAVNRGELHLAYQPIVAAGDGGLTSVEALLRWTHPSRGAIPPAVVIPLAEQSGQIIEIGRWVLQRAWSDRQRWQVNRGDGIGVSVNVSTHQLMSAGFVGTVTAIVETTAIEPRLLTLEMTESVFVRDGERALIVLNDLKAIGVKLALDDFGTGYSSLSYLMKYPVDIVKVDQTFVASLGENPASSTIVAAIIQLAHGLGMTVVSEGVETAEQYDRLTELGCDSCQGMYFASPMPAASLDDLLQHSRAREVRLPTAVVTIST